MVSVTQKSKNSFLKEKNLTLKTINIFIKKCIKATKRRQKSDKLSLFQITSVAFCRPPKKAIKSDKSDNLSLFHFVGAHPSSWLQNRL